MSGPYCGQPVTHRKLEEIRERVWHEEQTRLKALEKQLREHAAAEVRAQTQQLATRAPSWRSKSVRLRERMKAARGRRQGALRRGLPQGQAESQRPSSSYRSRSRI